MSAEWTAERLDAQALNTVVGPDDGNQEPTWIRGVDPHVYQWWSLFDGFGATSETVLARLGGRVCVLAFPPDALLAAETAKAVYELTMWGDESIQEIMRAAIEHVTGGTL